ncbi:Brix domain-containing protein 1 [Harpegnathos saltator]|uniref:Ribosome production factor 2 homolog n=1 Tax=Harpegnathos saltator TaxID=610380 RepID=E2BMJ3_HARSA|nr:Brix domain-containing protein 1 [Harpegnathos saltator]
MQSKVGMKPTTHKGKKAILKKEPKLVEGIKETLFLKGSKASECVVSVMKDLYDIKKPHACILHKKHCIRPFENVVPLEQLTSKHNAPLFMMASHNKKRPHNLVIGRTYENTLLDMIEFGVENYSKMQDFKVAKITSGIKPLLVFCGELFNTSYAYIRIKNLFVDMFQRERVEKITLQGLEHVLCFTACEHRICINSFRILLKKSDSDSTTPKIDVEEIGPRVDLVCRRNKFASEDLFKQACKMPKAVKIKKKKNISEDKLGTTYGSIHVGAQNLDKIQTRKMKGLKKTLSEKKSSQKRKLADHSNDDVKKIKAAT